MKKFSYIVFVSSLFLAPALQAIEGPKETGLTLADVIEAVKANNPSLSAAKRQLNLLQAEMEITPSYPNPGLEIEKSVSGDANDYEIKAVQPMPLTRKAGTARAAASADLEAAKIRLEALQNFILVSVRKAWYALHIARERRNFEEANLQFSMDILNKIEMRMQTGEAGNSDLARAKVEASKSGYHLQESQTMLRSAAGELNSLMGRRPDSPVALSESPGFSLTPAAPEPGPLETYTETALANRVEPRALSLNSRAAGLNVALEKGKRLPVPELGLVYGRDGGGRYSRLFLGLELPVWYNNKGGIQRAQEQKSALSYEERRLELEIRREVYAAWLEMDLAQKRLISAKQTVFLLNDLRRSASQDYLSGKIDLASFYETNRVFLEENVNYLDALKDYYEKKAQMDAVTNSGEEK